MQANNNAGSTAAAQRQIIKEAIGCLTHSIYRLISVTHSILASSACVLTVMRTVMANRFLVGEKTAVAHTLFVATKAPTTNMFS